MRLFIIILHVQSSKRELILRRSHSLSALRIDERHNQEYAECDDEKSDYDKHNNDSPSCFKLTHQVALLQYRVVFRTITFFRAFDDSIATHSNFLGVRLHSSFFQCIVLCCLRRGCLYAVFTVTIAAAAAIRR